MPGKCILHKVDSGCGWNLQDLLNKCWLRGVYIYPSLPNSTSMQQEMNVNFYGLFKGVLWRNLAKITMTCYAKEITMSLGVGTLPDGYVRTNPLPQVPTKQSVQTSRICLPPYFGLPMVIPMLRWIMGPAIARASIPWWFNSLNLTTSLCY